MGTVASRVQPFALLQRSGGGGLAAAALFAATLPPAPAPAAAADSKSAAATGPVSGGGAASAVLSNGRRLSVREQNEGIAEDQIGAQTPDMIAADNQRCESLKVRAIESSAKVQYMMRAINAHGCAIDEHFIKCQPCKHFATGHFSKDADDYYSVRTAAHRAASNASPSLCRPERLPFGVPCVLCRLYCVRISICPPKCWRVR
jgi:hypothetical protein